MTYRNIIILSVLLWCIYIVLYNSTRRHEKFRISFRNPFKGGGFRSPVKMKRGGSSTSTESGAAGTAGAGADAAKMKASGWQKADTVFGGLSLATLPLMFIPFGGGGGGDGGYGGSVLDDPNTSSGLMSSSSVSSSSSCLLLVVGVIAVVLMNEKK